MADCAEPIIPIAEASEEAIAAILDLNRRNVIALSELDRQELERNVQHAFKADVVGNGRGFLLAFDQSAGYDSPNFRWFHARYPRFVYIDRVVVAEEARGQGLASRLYEELFRAALGNGHSLIACEVNVEPPNRASDRFHASFGFEEAGRARLNAGKEVRYLVKRLSP